MNRFLLGALFGSLSPAVAIYFAGGSRSACAIIGTLVPLAFALKFPRKIGRALLWIAGDQKQRGPGNRRCYFSPCDWPNCGCLPQKPGVIDADFLVKKIQGHEVYERPDGFSVPSLDRDSTFDTLKDAARFIRAEAERAA